MSIRSGVLRQVANNKRTGDVLGFLNKAAQAIRPSTHTELEEYSRNVNEVDDRKESAGQDHRENATTSTFHKLKPASPVGKGMEVAENVADAANRVVKGVTGPNPGNYIQETLEGKNNK